MLQPLGNVERCHRRHAGGRQLDGQRQSIQSPARVDERRHFLAARGVKSARTALMRSASSSSAGAGRAHAALGSASGSGSSSGRSGTTASPLTASRSRLVASTHTPRQCSTMRSSSGATVGSTCSQLSTTTSIRRDASASIRLSSTAMPVPGVAPDGSDHRRADAAGVGDVAEFADACAIPSPADEPVRRFERQPCLAHPRRTGDGHQPRPFERGLELPQRALATHEAGRRDRQCTGPRRGGRPAAATARLGLW